MLRHHFSYFLKPAALCLLASFMLFVPVYPVQAAETVKLRGYGTVTADFTPTRARFTCTDAAHAEMLQGKLLADLFWDAGDAAVVKSVPLNGGTATIHVWPGYGAMLAARVGSQVVVRGEDSEAALVQAAQGEVLLKSAKVQYAPVQAYPNYLDFYDLKAFASYVFGTSIEGLGAETHWPFLKKFGLGGLVTQEPEFHFNNPAPKVVDWSDMDFQAGEAERNGGMIVPGFAAAGVAPYWWIAKHPQDLTQPSPATLMGVFGQIGGAGAALESWWTPLADKEAGGLAFERMTMDRYKNSPAVGGWFVYGGSPGLEEGFHGLSGEFWDYSLAGQTAFRQWLQHDRGCTLTALGKRWHSDANYYKSWDQVFVPDTNSFFGNLNANCLRIAAGWKWKLATGSADDPQPAPDAVGWLPVTLPPSFQQDTLPWKPAYYHTTFDAAAWAKHQPGSPVYLVCDLYVTEPTHVWLNGEDLGLFKTKQPDDGPFALDVTSRLKPGVNAITLRVPGHGKLLGPIFLTHTEPRFYPDLGPERNAQWVDLKNWQTLGTYESHLAIFQTARMLDPDRPMVLSSDDIEHTGDTVGRLARVYGAGVENTGREAWYYPWNPGLGIVDGFYGTSEPSGIPVGTYLDKMVSWMTFDGDSHHTLFFDVENFIQREKQDGWFTRNAPLVRLFGKSLRETPKICLLRSVKTSKLGISTPYIWDIGRGEIQSAHYDNAYSTEEELELGLVQDYPVLMDTGSVILDPPTIAAIRRYVEAGGTFIALQNTGRNTSDVPNTWPITALTGFTVLASTQGGTIKFNTGLPLFKNFEGRVFQGEGTSVDWHKNETSKGVGLVLKAAVPDAVPLAAWEDGSTAVGYRPLGKGRIIVLGSTFWRSGKDVAGIWQSQSEVERGFFQELFGDLGVQRNATSASSDVWTRKYITKNGLQDWLIAYNDSDTPTTTSVSLHVGPRPAQVLDMLTKQPMGFTYTDDGWVHVANVTLPLQGMRIFGVQKSSLVGGLPFWWGEKTKYWKAITPAALSALPISTARLAEPNETLPMDSWRFLPDRDNSVAASPSWLAPGFNDSTWMTIRTETWNTQIPSLADYHGVGLYRAKFMVPKAWAGKRVILGLYSFNGGIVANQGDFAVNGHPVATYLGHGGNQTLTYLISDFLLPGANVLTVKVTGGQQASGISGAVWIGTEKTLSPAINLAGEWQAVGGDFTTKTAVRIPGEVKTGSLVKNVTVPASWAGRQVYLHLETGSEQWLASVLVNGHPISYTIYMHHWGIRPEINVTLYLKFGESNRIELWPQTPLQQGGTPSNTVEELATLQAAILGCDQEGNVVPASLPSLSAAYAVPIAPLGNSTALAPASTEDMRAVGPNLLLNPGFEDWAKSDQTVDPKKLPTLGTEGVPAQWLLSPESSKPNPLVKPAVAVYKDTAVKHGGTASVRLEAKAPTDIIGAMQFVPVEPDTVYTVRCWLKGENVGSGVQNGGGAMVWANPGPAKDYYTHWEPHFNIPKVKDGTFEWQPYEFTVTTGSDAGQMSVVFQLRNASGKLWYDDVEVVKNGMVKQIKSF